MSIPALDPASSELQAFAGATGWWLMVHDACGQLIFANAAARQHMGLPAEGALPGDWGNAGWQPVDGAHQPVPLDQLPSRLALSTGQPQLQRLLGVPVQRHAEQRRWFLVDSVPVQDAAGRIERVVTMAADVTALQDATQPDAEPAYRHIVDRALAGICQVDPAGRIVYVNRRLNEMLGFKPRQLIGRPVDDLFEYAALPSWADRLRQEADGSGAREVLLRCQSRGWLPAMVTATVVGGGGGQLLLLFQDITDRKRSEEALRRSEARFRALIEQASDIVLILGGDGKVNYCSPSTERLFDLPEHGWVGRSLWRNIHLDDLLAIRSSFEDLTARPEAAWQWSSRVIAARFRCSDGSWRSLEGVATNLLDEPAVAGIVFNLHDVTDRKRAEERAQYIYDLIGSLTHDAIITTDRTTRVRSWNLGAERLYGWTSEEVIGQPLPIAPPERRREALRTARRVRQRGETHVAETVRLTKSGERIPVLSSWSAIPLRDGTIGLLSIAKDLRQEHELRRQLQEQAEAPARLHERERIAMDLHDGVIQSLYAVTISLGAIRRQTARADPAPAAALTAAIDQLTAAIDQVRSYIRDLNTLPLAPLGPALRSLASNLQAASQLQVYTQIDTAEDKLTPDQTNHVLSIAREALSNVARHAQATGVEIQLARDEQGLTLTIRDDGQGFNLKRRGAPRGYGLGNMHERARLLGATFGIDSAVGKGTRVWLQFNP